MQTHTFEPFRPGGRICVAVVEPYTGAVGMSCGLTAEAPVHREANTPAEARTGVSDRTAAALDVVYGMRQRALTSTWLDRNTRLSELDLIEAALREGGQR